MASALKVPTIFTAIDKVSSIVKKMGKNVQGFTNKVGVGIAKTNRLFNKFTPGLGDAGKQFLNFASAAAIAGGVLAGAKFSADSIMEYEVALHSLEAVTGESAAKFRPQIESIAKNSKKSAIDVAASFETIGSAMSQYLDNPKALGQITEAGITLAKASRQELQPTLENLTSVMNQFKLGAEEATKTINILTAGEVVGSVSTAKIAAGLQEFGANAYNANVKLSESVALLETLGKQMDHSKIAVGARNILSVMDSAKGLPKEALESMKKHGVNLNVLMDKSKSLGERIRELSKIQKDAVAVTKVFGKENMTAANVIFGNLDTYDKWQGQIEKIQKAEDQAKTNSATLTNKIEELKNSFINASVSGDKLNPSLEKVKDVLGWAADNMETLIKWTIYAVAIFTTWKAIVLATSVIMGAYNIGLGIMGALSATASIAIGQSTLALAAYNVTTKIATAAQWLWNAAMAANPIGLVIVAIAVLIGLIVLIVKKWDTWGASVMMLAGFFTPWLSLIISLVMAFYRNWDMITKAFKKGGIVGGLKAIGKVLLDVILMPVEQLLKLLSKIPGLSKLAGGAASSIHNLRAGLGVETGEKPALGTTEAKATEISTQNNSLSSLNVNLNDPGGFVSSTSTSGPLKIPVNVTPTSGAR